MDPFEKEATAEYYADSVNFTTNLYTFIFDFAQMEQTDQPPKPVVRVRMSPQHAKIMSLLLRKNVQEYERRVGTIILPEQLYDDLGIKDE